MLHYLYTEWASKLSCAKLYWTTLIFIFRGNDAMIFYHMSSKLNFLNTSIGAKFACKRFFSCMCSNMSFHICFHLHDFITIWTRILPIAKLYWFIKQQILISFQLEKSP